MYASATTYADVIPQIYLLFPSPSRARRRSHHPTTTRVPLSGHAYGSETACHNRTARVSSTHTAAIDDPHTARGDLPHPPCVTPRTHARRVRSHGPRPQGRVCHPLTIGSESRACKSTPPPSHTVHAPQVYPACAPLDDPSVPASRSRLRARAPQNPPVAVHAAAHAPPIVALIGHTRPSSPPLSTKLPPSSPTVRPAPRTRRVVPLPAWGRRPPPSHTGAGPDRMPIKMCRSREPATTAGPERARISAPAPHGGAGQPGPP